MFNETQSTIIEYDCIGFVFDPINALILLKHYHVTDRLNGETRTRVAVVESNLAALTDEVKVNPTTLKVVAEDDPSGVPAYTYIYSQFGNIKTLVEGFALANA